MIASPVPSRPSAVRALARVLCLIGLASAVGWALACGSTPRGESECETIESARCAKLATSACVATGAPLPGGDADGCSRFYKVQCERGIADDAQQPTTLQLNRCLAAINASCDVARAPETYVECGFLSTSNPPDASLDTAPASDADDAAETASDAAAEASDAPDAAEALADADDAG